MRRRIAIAILITLGGIVWAATHWATHRAVAGEPFTAPHDAHDPSHAAPAGSGYLSTSLTLCLALALVLAATAALETHRSSRGRSLWLFGVVPVLGILVEAVAASPLTPAGIASGLVELAPLALVSLVVQVAVALVALRLAHGILHLAEAVARAVVETASVAAGDGRPLFAVELNDRAPSARLSYAGSQRAPPALQPAF